MNVVHITSQTIVILSQQKKRAIGTLNMFLFYIVFTNDLP